MSRDTRAVLSGAVLSVEGLDGAGKSTLVAELRRWASECRLSVEVLSAFKSRSLAAQLKALNARLLLSGREAVVMYAADVACRSAAAVARAERGELVLWDKHVLGMAARDLARGHPAELVHALYASVPAPDLVLQLDVPPSVAFERKCHASALTMWECGLDVLLHEPVTSIQSRFEAGSFGLDELRRHFVWFQERVAAAYEPLLREVPHVRLDASKTPEVVAERIRHEVCARLARP